MPQFEPNGQPGMDANAIPGNAVPANAVPANAAYYPPNPGMQNQMSLQMRGANPYAPQGQGQPYYSGGGPSLQAANMSNMYDQHNPAGMQQQTIQVQVQVPNNNNTAPNLARAPSNSQPSRRNVKEEEPKQSCCKSCLTPCWIAFVIIYLVLGIAYVISVFQDMWFIMAGVFVVILIMDGVLIKIRDEHNVLCDCSSDPIDDGRVKACMFLLIAHFFFVVFGSVYYARPKDNIWGYCTAGTYVFSFLAGMYVASEPPEE